MTTEIRKMIEKLPEMDWWGRQKIIRAIIAHPEDKFISFLETGIRDHSNAEIRNIAMEIYAALGIRAFSSLSVLLQNEDPEIRLFAVNVLCTIADEKALPLLAGLLYDPDINVRSASAEAIGKIGSCNGLSILREALRDNSWVALSALNAVGEIGGEQALEILYEALRKKGLREMAIQILEKAGTQESIQYLALCLEYEDLREAAVKAIIKIAEREGCRPRPEYFISLAHTLKEMYLSADADKRRQAFIALCWLEDILTVPYLIESLDDEELQEYAIEGLLHVGKKAICHIVDNLKQTEGHHRVTLAKILNMLDEDIALLQFAEDQDPEVRTEVALVLGSIPLERATTALQKMLDDSHEEVRLAARKSLDSIKKVK
jgi:HEAT repeat protein